MWGAMPALILVNPISTAQAKDNARTTDDEYGYRARFRTHSIDELIAAFNPEVGSRAWVHARGVCLVALRDALLATDLDCSSFISDKGMNMDRLIARQGDAIVPVGTSR